MKADVLILGSGPAGLQAAIHASRKKAATAVVGKVSGSALHGAHIENYFGISGTSMGTDLLDSGVRQAESFGCRFLRQNVSSCRQDGSVFTAVLESGEEISAKAVIIATGIARKKLGVPGEKEFFGKGVSYCASCDCNFYKGAKVMLVGNESEAAISAEMMTRYASKVYWATDATDADESLIKRAADAGVITLKSMPAEIRGKDNVTSVKMKDGTEAEVSGVFIELGGRSSADLAMDLGIMPEMDDTIKVDGDCGTSVKGVFACGDVTGRPWQLAKAVGEGAVAGLAAAEYARNSQ